LARALFLAVLLILGLSPLLYSLQLNFYADDFVWLEKAYLSSSDPSVVFAPWLTAWARPLAQAFFFVEFLAFGFEALGYNLMGLLIHLGVGLLVWRLALRMGVPSFPAAIGALFFLAGWAHYVKPLVWICSHSIVVATLFALAGMLSLLPLRERRDSARSARFPFAAFMFSIAAMISHETLVLAPLGLAFLAWNQNHPRCGSTALAAGVATASYLVLTAGKHGLLLSAGVYELGPHILGNLLSYLASLAGPMHSGRVQQAIGHRLGLPDPLLGALPNLVAALGMLVGLWLLFLLWTRRGTDRGILGISCLFLLAPLPLAFEPNWVDSRYAYAPSAFLAPALCSAVVRFFPRAGRRRVLATIGLAIFYFAILAGSATQSWKAVQRGRSENTIPMWEHLLEITEGRAQEIGSVTGP
jgi:hypothetical protein